MNGDTFFGVDLTMFGIFHGQTDADVSIALYHVKDADRYTPVDVATDGRILSMQAMPTSNNGALINGGVYLLGRAVLDQYSQQFSMPLSLEEQLFPGLMKCGARFFGHVVAAPFIDIGVPEDYLRAAVLLQAYLPLDA
jgi:D-glycero-alpha-D-manno-heptose 1-phosphate guanylyltransferase